MELNAEQKRIATQEPKGHALLRGVAGSGKTSVGIYRVSFLLNNYCFAKDDAILLATFNRTLVNYIDFLYKKMAARQQAEFASLFEVPEGKVDIKTVDSLIFGYYQAYARKKGLHLETRVPNAVSYEIVSEGVTKFKKQYPSVRMINQKNTPFLLREINWIKDCLYLEEEEYQNADRTGMGRSPQENKPQRLKKNSNTRRAIFQLMRFYDEALRHKKLISFSDLRLLALEEVRQTVSRKYTHIIVDESQDLTRSQLLFLQQIFQEKAYSSILFIADTAQNFYPQSWLGSGNSFASIGFNMTGRSNSLSKNFRTTTHISKAAYSLIEACPEIVEDENFVPPALIDKQGVYPACKAFVNEQQQAIYIDEEMKHVQKDRSLGSELIVINRNFEHIDDPPVFRNTWSLSTTIRCVYRHLKTGRQTAFCYDPNQPTTIELGDDSECEHIEKEALQRLPVYGRIAAGQPIHLNPELDQDIHLPMRWVTGGQYFILRVQGDSMTGAHIDDGDLVVIRSQESADNLDIVVVALGEEGTLKRFSKKGNNAILLPENSKYEPILLEGEQVRIMGIAVGVIKPHHCKSRRVSESRRQG